jgi:hypothetical protein
MSLPRNARSNNRNCANNFCDRVDCAGNCRVAIAQPIFPDFIYPGLLLSIVIGMVVMLQKNKKLMGQKRS